MTATAPRIRSPFFEGGGGLQAHELEAEMWIKSVREGKELWVKPEQALVVTEILEAIYTSAATHKPVFF